MEVSRDRIRTSAIYGNPVVVPARKKKRLLVVRKRFQPDHFSLKKVAKGIGNVAKDVVKLSVQPVKLAVASVTGKPVNTTYSTKVGAIVGKVHDTGSKALTATVKGFADTVTGGLATKAANLVRKDEYKEKAFSYNEQKSAVGADLGKTLNKVAAVLPTVGAVTGGVVGGALAGKKALSLGKKDEGQNMKESQIEIGPNVLENKAPEFSTENAAPTEGPMIQPKLPVRESQAQLQDHGNTLTASMGLGSLDTKTILIAVVAIVLLFFVASKKKG